MTQAQIDQLKSIGYNAQKVAPIPQYIVDKARTKSGHESTIVDIPDEETKTMFPNCTHLVLIPWLKINGLWSEYEDFIEGNTGEVMDINFSARIDQAKEISNKQNGIIPETTPAVPKAPEIPKTPVAEVDGEEIPVLDNKATTKYKSYVERLDYIKEQGFVHDASANGYVLTKDTASFCIDSNVVKNFQAPDNVIDAEWIKYVELSKKTEWEHPIKKLLKEEPVSNVPDITEGLENIEVVSETVNEKSPGVKLTLAEEQEIISQRNKFLKDYAFVQDKATYIFKRDDWEISSRLVKDLTEKGNIAFNELQNQIKNEYANNLDTDDDAITLKAKEEAQKRDNEAIDKIERERKQTEAMMAETKITEEMATPVIIKGFVEISNEEAEKLDIGEGKNAIGPDVHEFDKEKLDSDITNFFSKLYEYNFKTLSINFTRLEKEGQVNVEITPKPFEDEEAFTKMRAINVKSSIEDLDKNFFNVIRVPLQTAEKIFINSDLFLKDLKKAEKETKAAKAKEEELKKAVESLEKYINSDKQTEATMTKRIEAVLDLDSENKIALAEKEKLSQGKLI